MKRCALLFGNTDGLEGVKKDIIRVAHFLKSGMGGAWNSTEIKIGLNLCELEIKDLLTCIRRACFDYVFVYFSGHGGMQRSTKLCLNKYDEYIVENELSGLASRQLMIFDCCRCFPSAVINSKTASVNETNGLNAEMRHQCRKRFERLMSESTPQEISLYASQPGGIAYDTANGGVYSMRLIDAAVEISKKRDAYVTEVHQQAVRAVRFHSLLTREYQCPDIKVSTQTTSPTDLVLAVRESLMSGFDNE